MITNHVIIILVLLSLQVQPSVILPPTSIDVCDGEEYVVMLKVEYRDLYKIRCIPMLNINININEQLDSQLAFQISKNAILSDDDGGKWSTESDIYMDFHRIETRFEFPLVHRRTVRNAYVSRTTSINCSPATSHCCLNYEYELMHNSTQELDFFTAGVPKLEYKLLAVASQDDHNLTLTLTPDDNIQSSGPFYAKIEFDIYPQIYFLPDDYIGFERNDEMDPFVVLGNVYVGDGINKIGISNSNFLSAMNNLPAECSASKGRSLIQVDGGLYYNQFSRFASNTVESRLKTTIYEEMTNTNISSSDPLRLSVFSPSLVSTVISLKADATSFKIRKLYAELIVLASGTYPLLEGDTSVAHYIDISNTGRVSGSVTVVNTECCYGIGDVFSCNALFSSKSSTLSPSETKKIVLIENVQYLLFRKTGYCQYSIRQQGVNETDILVPFDYTVLGCEPPNTIEIIEGEEVCISKCSVDQDWDEDDKTCKPTDCWVKYGGARNWYDANDGLCKPAAKCDIYDNKTNTCIEYPEQQPIAPTPITTPASTPLEPINCGPHGNYDEESGNCICHDGWTTDMQQPIFDFKWCMVESVIVPPPPYSEMRQWEVIVIVCAIILGIIVAIVGTCILVKRCKRKKKYDEEEPSSEPPSETSIDISSPPSPRLSQDSEEIFDALWRTNPNTHEGEVTPHGLTPFSSYDSNGLISKETPTFDV